MEKNTTKVYSTSDNKILDSQVKILENRSPKEKRAETVWERICRENREADERNSKDSKDGNNSSNFDPSRGW